MPEKFACEIFEDDEHVLYYPRHCQLQDPPIISFGSNTKPVRSRQQPDGNEAFSLSNRLAKELGLPEITSSCFIQDEETLYSGPLIGIYTNGFTPYQLMPAGERSAYFAKQIVRLKALGAIPFLFGSEHINWELGEITGYWYHEGRWKKKKFPFPDAIFERSSGKYTDIQNRLQTKDKMEHDYLIPWFIPGLYNGVDLIERLCNDTRAEPYMPEVHTFRAFSDLERMAEKYGMIFVKHMHASKESKQVIYDLRAHVYYLRLIGYKKQLLKVRSVEGLAKRLFEGEPATEFVIQQGIHVVRWNNKPVTFLVELKKEADWNPISVQPVLSSEEAGAALELTQLYPDIEKRQKIISQLYEAAIDLIRAIEDHSGGTLTSIRLHLALDRSERAWLLGIKQRALPSDILHPGLQDSSYTHKLHHVFSSDSERMPQLLRL